MCNNDRLTQLTHKKAEARYRLNKALDQLELLGFIADKDVLSQYGQDKTQYAGALGSAIKEYLKARADLMRLS